MAVFVFNQHGVCVNPNEHQCPMPQGKSWSRWKCSVATAFHENRRGHVLWGYGLSYGYPLGGGGCGVRKNQLIFDTETEAIAAAVEEVLFRTELGANPQVRKCLEKYVEGLKSKPSAQWIQESLF